mgnify:CR=1 FL=1
MTDIKKSSVHCLAKNNVAKEYYRYWGKAEKDGDGFHLLPYHCLDVAAVVAVWWEVIFPRKSGEADYKIK